jgi:hypothetical protein
MQLNTKDSIGEDISVYFGHPREEFKHFVFKNYDTDLHRWDYSCIILIDFGLSAVISPHDEIYKEEDRVTVLYLTNSGEHFLSAVRG